MKKRQRLALILIVSLLTVLVQAHDKITIDAGTVKAEGAINHMLPINIPLPNNLIHSASTTLQEDIKYLVVHPATVYPFPVTKLNNNFGMSIGNSFSNFMLPTNTPTLLQQLRTYHSAHYNDIIICDEYIFMMLIPNKIVVVKQVSTGNFKMQNQYVLQELTQKNVTKMYRILNGKNNEILLVVQNSSTYYKLGIQQYKKLQLQKPQHINHLQFIDDNTFLAATRQNGLILYKLSQNSIQKIQSYSCETMRLTNTNTNTKSDIKQDTQTPTNDQSNIQCLITDFSYNVTSETLYILDSLSGLHTFVLSDQQFMLDGQSKDTVTLVQDCEALDMVSDAYFVLVCSVGMPNSYIQQIIKFNDPIVPNKTVVVKKDPIYHSCNFNDLVVTQDYFLFFDSYTIDVFWSSLKTGLYSEQSAEHSKQHFNIPGLQVFAIKQFENSTFLYVVQSNFLTKYQLFLFNGVVYVYSPIPITKEIKIQAPGKCDPDKYAVLNNNRQISKNYECLYEVKVQIKITEMQNQVSQDKVSMSIGAIVIMIAVIIILTWICLVKYRGLEKHARKILTRYQQRSRYNDNKFNI